MDEEKNLEGPGHGSLPYLPTCFKGFKISAESGDACGLQVGRSGVRGHALPPASLTWSSKTRTMQKEKVCLGAPGTTWLPHFGTPLTSNTRKPQRSWKRPPK